MKHNTWYPMRQGDQINWHVNWINKLPNWATALGLSPAQLAAAIADSLWLIYVLQAWLGAVRAFSLGATDSVTEAQTGTGNAPMVLPPFTAPALPAGGTPVNPGALTRTFALVQLLRDGGKLTEAMASDLGLTGSEAAEPDYASLIPVLKLSRTPTAVNIGWTWGGNAAFLDMIELQVDRGTGWQQLAFDTTPGYTDSFTQPATATQWKYRAIYRVDDHQVGQWSREVSIMVGP